MKAEELDEIAGNLVCHCGSLLKDHHEQSGHDFVPYDEEPLYRLITELRQLQKFAYEGASGKNLDEMIVEHGKLIALLRRNDEMLNYFEPMTDITVQAAADRYHQLRKDNAKVLGKMKEGE